MCVSQAVLADGGHICRILGGTEKRHRAKAIPAARSMGIMTDTG